MSGSGPVLRACILGCGSSGGVPRVDGDWGVCDPQNPKNVRKRCSLLVERAPSLKVLETGVATRVLIDTSPDLRQQMLDSRVSHLDGVAFTHTHADQAHGIDDVRAFVYRRRALLDCVMSQETHDRLHSRFGYIFETPDGSKYPPLMQPITVDAGAPVAIPGPGGALRLSLFDVRHGSEPCSGVRIGPLAYTPDVDGLDSTARQALAGISVWIVDALRDAPHPSHAHVDQALDWLNDIRPELGVLTNLHIDLDYAALNARLPQGVRAAYDRMSVIVNESNGAILHSDPS